MRLFLIFFLLLQSISFAQINPALNQLKPKKSKISRLELELDSFDINKIDSNYKQFIIVDSRRGGDCKLFIEVSSLRSS